MTKMIVCLAACALALPALAEDKAAAAPAGAMPDMSKMGPMSRPITKEKDDKKGIDEFEREIVQRSRAAGYRGSYIRPVPAVAVFD